jgi:hypothetical protein
MEASLQDTTVARKSGICSPWQYEETGGGDGGGMVISFINY